MHQGAPTGAVAGGQQQQQQQQQQQHKWGQPGVAPEQQPYAHDGSGAARWNGGSDAGAGGSGGAGWAGRLLQRLPGGARLRRWVRLQRGDSWRRAQEQLQRDKLALTQVCVRVCVCACVSCVCVA
jgi:hypothetical protein